MKKTSFEGTRNPLTENYIKKLHKDKWFHCNSKDNKKLVQNQKLGKRQQKDRN